MPQAAFMWNTVTGRQLLSPAVTRGDRYHLQAGAAQEKR